MFQVKKAQREKLRGAIALVGPSGSGKTLGALYMAYGMMKAKYPDMEDYDLWEKVGFIDTEHKRSLIYANLTKSGVKIGSFLHIDFPAPYSVDRYEAAVKAVVDAGAEVVVVDSLSHAWEADGGLLDLQAKFGGKFQDWAKVNPHYKRFIDLVTGVTNDVHMINCIRTKQGYEIDSGNTGKLEVKKLGLKPVQRDSLEYELQIVFNVNMDHIAETSKDNSEMFEGQPNKITPEVGGQIYRWLEEGVDVAAEEREERVELDRLVEVYRTESEEMAKYISDLEKKTKGFDKLHIQRLRDMVTHLNKHNDKLKAEAEEVKDEETEPVQ